MKIPNWLNIKICIFLLIASMVPSCSKMYHVTVEAEDASMGTTSGSGTYAPNATVEISATPASGYIFVRWKDGNTDNPRNIRVSSDLTFIAIFEAYHENTPFESGTVTDLEGNVYPTLLIGNQWWMAKNLKVKKTADGQDITTENDVFSHYTPLCYYITDEDEVLYNWLAATNVCPEGWHLPSSDEWSEMEASVGQYDQFGYEGDPTKIAKALAARNAWHISSVQGTPGFQQMYNNATGFRALPLGRFTEETSLVDKYYTAIFWTSDVYNYSIAHCRSISYNITQVESKYDKKSVGMSVRCVSNGDNGNKNDENP